ncbi:hypothetical protein ACLI09_05255 [Flavobacterium sp. RHBU_24]|uniref:hypothetical protein n=1 Tax=Flavobacterium sp. RHBU_24 TaxID=3391185 RepID=UPI00398463B3
MNKDSCAVNILELSKKVLHRLAKMDFEKREGNSDEKLIFPSKFQANGEEDERISEQELRFIFVEEFRNAYPNLYYSIETPTKKKYKLAKNTKDHKTEDGRSASHDLSIYKRDSNKYSRILNIEFKYKNSSEQYTSKDILKLIYEDQDAAFIYLVKNTSKRTLPSMFEKLKGAFLEYKATKWINKNKTIMLVILSLEQKKLVHFSINDLADLDAVFKIEKVNINDFIGSDGWGSYII